MTNHIGPDEAMQARLASDIQTILGADGDRMALHVAASLVEFAAYERAQVSAPSDTATLILIAAALSRTAGDDPDALQGIEAMARAVLERTVANAVE